jgi:hypothetical protein
MQYGCGLLAAYGGGRERDAARGSLGFQVGGRQTFVAMPACSGRASSLHHCGDQLAR